MRRRKVSGLSTIESSPTARSSGCSRIALAWPVRAERKKPWSDAAEQARAEFDLAITSVLLDAGAGAAWRYRDGATGAVLARSEGLAVASLRAMQAGLFSADPAIWSNSWEP